MITKQSIDGLKQAVDMLQLASDYTQMKRSGTSWVGLSPFSAEKTPSFRVNPEQGSFYCFSTSQGGDAIRFLQIKEGYTFVEAVESLAERFRFNLEYEKGSKGAAGPSSSRIKRLKQIHDLTTQYFCKALQSDTREGGEVRDYWVGERGFSLEDASKYEVGYAPIDGSRLEDFLRKRGFDSEELEASGLFIGSSSGRSGRMLPKFRGRLMIPIRDFSGQVVAFTGRKLPMTPTDHRAEEAKYVNSPATDLFKKGAMLFGLHLARKVVNDQHPFLLVEGQLDAIRCWSIGIEQAIAAQGTAITDIQLAKLRNYHPSLIMCLDGDSAGFKAALRVLPMALSTGLQIQFLRLGASDDPDSVIRREGAEHFKALLSQSISIARLLSDTFFSDTRLDAVGLSRASEQCFEIIHQSPSVLVKNQIIEELASAARLDPRALKQDFSQFERNRKRGAPAPNENYNDNPLPSQESPGKLRSVETDLLAMLLHLPSIRPKIIPIDGPEMLSDADMDARILRRVWVQLQEEPDWTPDDGLETICETSDEHNLVYRIMSESPAFEEAENQLEVCLRALRLRHLKRQVAKVDAEINRLPSDQSARLGELLKQKMDLHKKIANP